MKGTRQARRTPGAALSRFAVERAHHNERSQDEAPRQ